MSADKLNELWGIPVVYNKGDGDKFDITSPILVVAPEQWVLRYTVFDTGYLDRNGDPILLAKGGGHHDRP